MFAVLFLILVLLLLTLLALLALGSDKTVCVVGSGDPSIAYDDFAAVAASLKQQVSSNKEGSERNADGEEERQRERRDRGERGRERGGERPREGPFALRSST